MSKYKTSINTTAKLAPDLKRYCSHLQELLQDCGKIMANLKKQNNLLSLLGLKQAGEFLKDDGDDDVKVRKR
jgi:hypothetical protein